MVGDGRLPGQAVRCHHRKGVLKMSERRAEYKAGNFTVADQPIAMTFRRAEWARIAVALRLVAKQIGSAEDLRLSQEISGELQRARDED